MINNSEIHCRRPIRLRQYDYSQTGAYFVTLCTQNRKILFGKIVDGEMVMNEGGHIAQQCWLDIPNHYPNAELDNFIVMPNHVHGIIIIKDEIVGAIHELPLRNTKMIRRKMLLPRIIGYFKMNTSKQINQIRKTPGIPVWQRNYYDHIIRNQDELNRIREYIINNPLQWEYDRENTHRIPNKASPWQTLEDIIYGKTEKQHP